MLADAQRTCYVHQHKSVVTLKTAETKSQTNHGLSISSPRCSTAGQRHAPVNGSVAHIRTFSLCFGGATGRVCECAPLTHLRELKYILMPPQIPPAQAESNEHKVGTLANT